MLDRLRALIEDRRHRRELRRWADLAARVERMPLSDLRDLRRRARQTQRELDKIHHAVTSRLTLPVIGSNAIRKPPRTDWAHRPEAWAGPVRPTGFAAAPAKTRIGSEVTVFHDATRSELTIRQVRNTRESDLAPFGLRLDVFNFDGSFLSLAVDMPGSALEGLRRTHLLRLAMTIESERPHEMFARLNLRHGPNTEQIVREVDTSGRDIIVEFDLYYTNFNEARGEAMWLDLIFESPSMNQVTVRDLTVTRRPRATL